MLDKYAAIEVDEDCPTNSHIATLDDASEKEFLVTFMDSSKQIFET